MFSINVHQNETPLIVPQGNESRIFYMFSRLCSIFWIFVQCIYSESKNLNLKNPLLQISAKNKN